MRNVVGGGGGVLLVRGREGREGAQPIVLGGDKRGGVVGGYECREVDLRPAQWDGGVGSGQDCSLRYVGDKGGDWGGGYIYSRLCEGKGVS